MSFCQFIFPPFGAFSFKEGGVLKAVEYEIAGTQMLDVNPSSTNRSAN